MSALHESISSEFTAARGQQEDGRWAERALSRLLLDDVRPDVAERAVREVLPVVADSGESARELFGEPQDWADDQCEAWQAEGGDVAVPPDPMTPRAAVIGSLVGASLLTAMFAVVSVLRGELTITYSPALVALPLLLSVGVVTMNAVYETVKTRRSFRAAVFVAAGSAVGSAAVIAAVLFTVRDVLTAEGSVLWHLALAAGWAGLAWAADRLWPRRARDLDDADVTGAWSDDEAWFAVLAHELRRRDDMTDARVAEIVGESRDHVAETGLNAVREFGSPRSYAGRFDRDRRIAARRSAYLWTVLTLLPLSLQLGDLLEQGWRWSVLDPWTMTWAAVIGLRAALAWRSLAKVAGASA